MSGPPGTQSIELPAMRIGLRGKCLEARGYQTLVVFKQMHGIQPLRLYKCC